MKLLITGFSGFVARHFAEYLDRMQIPCEICGIDINEPAYDYKTAFSNNLKLEYHQVNLLDTEALEGVFKSFVPDHILHLASFSSVSYSWKHPSESFINNCVIFLNLMDMVKKFNPECRILSVGSSEEYGNVDRQDLPLRENQPLHPLSPYAVARVSQEQLSKIYADNYHYRIVMTRSFNHIGPRQDARFVIPSFIERILAIKNSGKDEGVIETGNVEIIRDFVDVRDVVRAYYILLTKGSPGEIYNICAGRRIALKDVIQMIAGMTGVKIATKVNPEYVRPQDCLEIVGTYYKMQSEFGWEPEISMETTIEDMLSSAMKSR